MLQDGRGTNWGPCEHMQNMHAYMRVRVHVRLAVAVWASMRVSVCVRHVAHSHDGRVHARRAVQQLAQRGRLRRQPGRVGRRGAAAALSVRAIASVRASARRGGTLAEPSDGCAR